MAGTRMQHVYRHERRRAAARAVLYQHEQSQFRRAAGKGRAYILGQPADGGRIGDYRQGFRRPPASCIVELTAKPQVSTDKAAQPQAKLWPYVPLECGCLLSLLPRLYAWWLLRLRKGVNFRVSVVNEVCVGVGDVNPGVLGTGEKERLGGGRSEEHTSEL